jgi:hypothetical protein
MNVYEQALKSKADELASSCKLQAVLFANPQLTKLSETANINAHGAYSLWMSVHNREDLATAMSVGKGLVWTKHGGKNYIRYSARLEEYDIGVEITAYDEALPPTCKVVTETIQHPAREAYTETVNKLVCDV